MYQLVMSDDIRDFLNEHGGGGVRLYPYARDLFYHPNGVLSMTIQIYDDVETQEFSFGFPVSGNLKGFLEQINEGDTL